MAGETFLLIPSFWRFARPGSPEACDQAFGAIFSRPMTDRWGRWGRRWFVNEAKGGGGEGDYKCTMIEAQGDNTGEMLGRPATGKHSRINLTDIVRIEDGKVAEAGVTWDTMGMLQQLGLIPRWSAGGCARLGTCPTVEEPARAWTHVTWRVVAR